MARRTATQFEKDRRQLLASEASVKTSVGPGAGKCSQRKGSNTLKKGLEIPGEVSRDQGRGACLRKLVSQRQKHLAAVLASRSRLA